MVFKSTVILTSLAFLFYGFNCMRSKFMITEFQRFGLSKSQQQLTGVFQILGALGLIIGLNFPKVGITAALGLSILMLLGFIVRLKIKDSFLESLPSFIFILVNAYLCYQFFQSI